MSLSEEWQSLIFGFPGAATGAGIRLTWSLAAWAAIHSGVPRGLPPVRDSRTALSSASFCRAASLPPSSGHNVRRGAPRASYSGRGAGEGWVDPGRGRGSWTTGGSARSVAMTGAQGVRFDVAQDDQEVLVVLDHRAFRSRPCQTWPLEPWSLW